MIADFTNKAVWIILIMNGALVPLPVAWTLLAVTVALVILIWLPYLLVGVGVGWYRNGMSGGPSLVTSGGKRDE
jgi:hypothetical protein